MSAISIKRAYEKPAKDDGLRVLVDRLWPRGLNKNKAKIDYWAKQVTPSTQLRKWFSHDPEKWNEFKSCYFKELTGHPEEVNFLIKKAAEGKLTLVFGSKEEKFNNAIALVEYLKKAAKSEQQ